MDRRTFVMQLVVLASALAFASTVVAQAPERIPALSERVAAHSAAATASAHALHSGTQEPRSLAGITVAAAGGMGVGIVGGAAAGALVYVLRGSPDTGDSWIGPGDPWLGAVIGAPVGSFAGARLANRGAGDGVVTAAAALLGAGGGLLGGALIGSATSSGLVAVAVLFGLGAGLPAYAEHHTSR